jgi:hypothetical protein
MIAPLIGAGLALATAYAVATAGVPAVPSAPPCRLEAAPVPARPLAPELLRLAAQYFHPAHRGLFLDVIKGTARYSYYDPTDPSSAGPTRPGTHDLQAT